MINSNTNNLNDRVYHQLRKIENIDSGIKESNKEMEVEKQKDDRNQEISAYEKDKVY